MCSASGGIRSIIWTATAKRSRAQSPSSVTNRCDFDRCRSRAASLPGTLRLNRIEGPFAYIDAFERYPIATGDRSIALDAEVQRRTSEHIGDISDDRWPKCFSAILVSARLSFTSTALASIAEPLRARMRSACAKTRHPLSGTLLVNEGPQVMLWVMNRGLPEGGA